MKPTEHELQVATDAAAKRLFEEQNERGRRYYTWDELHVLDKNDWRAAALPTVKVVLEALPDRLEEIRKVAKTYDFPHNRPAKFVLADIRRLLG